MLGSTAQVTSQSRLHLISIAVFKEPPYFTSISAQRKHAATMCLVRVSNQGTCLMSIKRGVDMTSGMARVCFLGAEGGRLIHRHHIYKGILGSR